MARCGGRRANEAGLELRGQSLERLNQNCGYKKAQKQKAHGL